VTHAATELSTAPARDADAAVCLCCAAAVATMVSIAAFEILLGLALIAVLIRDRRLRWPPLLWPFAAWVACTLLSAAASGHIRGAWPQARKLYVFLMLFVVFSGVRNLRQVRGSGVGWAAAASASAAWGLEQFVRKVHAAQAAHMDFYTAYVADRITGFMGHWMTFSGHMMIALLVIGALVLFSWRAKEAPWLIAAAGIVGAGLLLAETRSMWGGAALGALVLLWMKRRWLVLAAPVVAGLLLLANPFGVRERAISIVRPNGDLDSNAFRSVTRIVGWEMIKAHPLLGVGPEQVGPQFDHYVPASVQRPLPSGYYGHLHNIYFHYAAERGLPALAALLWFVGRALFDFVRAAARMPVESEGRWVVLAAIAVILAVMSSGYYEVNLGDSEVLAAFLAVLAVGYVAVPAAETVS
jgi:putative inorganic carbon (hco3(-)) transporter